MDFDTETISLDSCDLSEKIAQIPPFKSHSFCHVFETGSTNDDLKNDWKILPPPKRILWADHQTNGRGQFDRKWEDRPGDSLLCSFTWEEKVNLSFFPFSLIAGIVLHRVLAQTLPLHAQPWLKWPNDIFLGDAKLAGILVEATTLNEQLFLVIGFGINLRFTDNWQPMNGKAIDLASKVEVPSPEILLESFFLMWHQLQNKFQKNSSFSAILREEYIQRSAPLWKKKALVVCPNEEPFEAYPETLEENGGIWVLRDSGRRQLLTSVQQFSPILR